MKVTTHFCKILDLGVSGNLFGGQLMYWLDEAAAVYAAQITGEKRIVTRRFSESLFQKPIHCGEIVEFHCTAPRKGHTSVTFTVLVKVADEIRFQTDCTFVALDEEGNKKLIDWEKSPLSRMQEE